MSETQTPPSKQQLFNEYRKENKQEEQEYDEFNVDSSMLLSKLEFEQPIPDSPRINYNTAQAKIKQLTQPDPMPYKKSKPYCGCGQYYSCTSSLYLHIRSKHYGIPPKDTIGGPKGIVKKPDQTQLDAVKIEQNNGTYQTYTTTIKKVDNPPPPQVVNNYSGRRMENTTPQGKKQCRFCPKTYSCNSSLNLHLKRKHQSKTTWDGRIQISARTEDKSRRCFECTICGLNYGSKSALGLHYNNKHSSKQQTQQGLPYDEDKVQKCGCGLVYQSRSALNMHVKKKHAGIYQKGTTQKPSIRTHHRSYRIQQDGSSRIQNSLAKNQGSSEEQERSIYDSQSQQNTEKNRGNLKPNEEGKIYKCGCNKTYSCSSSLNLHIKRNHNWIVPQGTIGGPRGMRVQEDIPIPQTSPTCNECQTRLQTSYFHCRNCRKHFMCSGCFWKGNYFTQGHQWEAIK